MADKAFGVDQLDILGNGTPTISAPNQLNLDCHTVAISTSVTVGANLTVNGNIDLGNASSDTISLTGVVDTNIIPSADSSKDIGSNSVRFANGYFDTVYGDGSNLTNLPASGISTSPSNVQATWKLGGGSGSGFTFTGPGQDGAEGNPDIYLVRGQRYLFDNTALAGNHPFEFRNAANNADYTDGVSGAQNGLQYINVQHDAPAQLKYRCTIHTNSMLGNIYIIGGSQIINAGVVTFTNVPNPTPSATLPSGTGGHIYSFDGLNLVGRDNIIFQQGGFTRWKITTGHFIPQSDSTVDIGTNTIRVRNGYFDTLDVTDLKLPDGNSNGLYIGGSDDLHLFHNGADSYVENDTGNLNFTNKNNNNIIFKTTNSETERLRITSAGDVGIANNSPSCKLAITDTAEHTAYASVTPSVTACMLQIYNNPPNETANDHATMQFGVNGGTHNRVASISAVVESAANRKLAFAFCTDEAGSRTEKMRIHGDGHVTKPLNPAFRARASSGGWKSFGNTSFNIMPFNATDCNNGNHYNTSTYKFTVPVSGNYYFYCQMQHDGTTTNGGTSGQMQIVVQGVAVIAYGKSGRQGEVVNCGTVWPCSAGNVIYCEGRTNLTNPDDWHGDSYYSFFTGYLVG